MRNFLIGVLFFLEGFSLLVTGFVWIYAPLRAKRMVEKYARFRME